MVYLAGIDWNSSGRRGSVSSFKAAALIAGLPPVVDRLPGRSDAVKANALYAMGQSEKLQGPDT